MNYYQSPIIEIVEVLVEKGFFGSDSIEGGLGNSDEMEGGGNVNIGW